MRRIGQIFVDLGYISDEQLEMLVEEQQQDPGELIGKVAEKMGLVTQEQIAQALAEQMDLQVVNLGELTVPDETIAALDEPMASLYRVIPVQFDDPDLTVATCDPQNLQIQDELRTLTGYEITIIVCTERDYHKAYDKYYAEGAATVGGIIEEIEADEDFQKLATEFEGDGGPIELGRMEELADSVPVRKLLNMVLLLAIKDQASDIHLEPFEDEFRIRIKANGVLYEMVPPPRHLAVGIVTRIKVMANLNIAERRMPQDGRIELTIGGHPVDLRVSVLPTMFGESVVMRVLDRTVVSLDLNKVGMNPETIESFRSVIARPNGIVLVTGPTGSGKTTTLYSALSELNSLEDKLITTEDPVEYDIDGIIQIPIDHEIGVTFASCLRAILRQDPDRILVGEIRDLETAEIAVQASLTGHMVFSTLHTNDAPSTITRLKDMGVPVFLITATVEAILAQRLVRRICTNCKAAVDPTEGELFDLGMTNPDGDLKFYRGAGCDQCNGTGYKGRVGLFELMIFNDEIRELVMRNASTDEMREVAREHGMVTLRDAGMQCLLAGTTTAEEVIRETILDA